MFMYKTKYVYSIVKQRIVTAYISFESENE